MRYLFSSHLRFSLSLDPFCSYVLFQRASWASLFAPRFFLADTWRASLEIFFSSVFAVLKACLPQVFLTWHSPLLRFPIASAVCALQNLSGLFHPVTLLRFYLQSFLLQEIEVFFFWRFYSPLEASSSLYRWLSHVPDTQLLS